MVRDSLFLRNRPNNGLNTFNPCAVGFYGQTTNEDWRSKAELVLNQMTDQNDDGQLELNIFTTYKLQLMYYLSHTSLFKRILIVAVAILVLIGCDFKYINGVNKVKAEDLAKRIVEQSDSILFYSINDVHSQSYYFNSLSDSFTLTNPETTLTIAIPQKTRIFLRNWKPDLGVFDGLNSEIDLRNGCMATLGIKSSNSTFDTIKVYVHTRIPIWDTIGLNIINYCDARFPNGYGELPSFTLIRGRYVRLN